MSEHESSEVTEHGEPAPRGQMATLLGRFSDRFGAEVAPVAGSVEAAADALEAAGDGVAAAAVLPRLRDLAHEIGQLADKVQKQQAYVAIFGPLKSGKSTLMNAMCAAYVSEVTCLPAYPCMVYVSHAPEPTFVLTRYDGSDETLHDRDRVHETIERSHAELNERIREVEAQGKVFDPAEHLPSAIRRIDVKVPAGDLAESGAVLVDTPGLYTRMRFGYDRMTRDFRDAAACAIFVVKTDNLFLEQVFDEFGELLELFSRIFLVVNLDASKKDLQPDGTLAPSLEHESPRRVVEAFEELAMTAPIKRAADEGRLGIYPVDLLGAASRRIRSTDGPGIDPPVGEADFGSLLGDLTGFLNSSDYLRAFVGDSLKRAGSLMDEVAAVGEDGAVAETRRDLAELVAERDEAQRRLTAVRRLRETDWRAALTDLEELLHAAAGQQAGQLAEEMGHAVDNEVHGWFQDEGSLAELEQQRLRPRLVETRKRLGEHVAAELSNRIDGESAGLKTEPAVLRDLETAGIELGGQARDALEAVDPTAAVSIPSPLVSFDEIPVRRGFWDWILFRSVPKVRRKLLGPEQAPDKPLSPAIKERRLREAGRAELRGQASSRLEHLLEEARGHLARRYFLEYAETVDQRIAGRLERAEEEAIERLEALGERLEAHQRVAGCFEDLEEAAAGATGEVRRLETEFVEELPEQQVQETTTEAVAEQDREETAIAPDPVPETAPSPPAAEAGADEPTVELEADEDREPAGEEGAIPFVDEDGDEDDRDDEVPPLGS